MRVIEIADAFNYSFQIPIGRVDSFSLFCFCPSSHFLINKFVFIVIPRY